MHEPLVETILVLVEQNTEYDGTQEVDDLSRRLVENPLFDWIPGMRRTDGARFIEGGWAIDNDLMESEDAGPDLRDFSTGAILYGVALQGKWKNGGPDATLAVAPADLGRIAALILLASWGEEDASVENEEAGGEEEADGEE